MNTRNEEPPTSAQLMQQYRQEEDSDYVATLLVLFIEQSPGLRFHSIEHPFPNGAKPDVACEYLAMDGGVVFEIKAKREMNSVIEYEADQIAKQIIRYSTTLNGWSTRLEDQKGFCDVIEIVNSSDVRQFESEITSRFGSLEPAAPRPRQDGLAFLGWERTEVLPCDEMKIRFFSGPVTDSTLLAPFREFNGFLAPLYRIVTEKNNRNIHLEIQSEHRLIVAMMEKIWGIYDFRTGLIADRELPGDASEDYFVKDGKIYFTIECLDVHFHWVPSGRAYCAKVKRDRLKTTCEKMCKLGFLDKEEVTDKTYYGMSLNRKGHDYLSDVCDEYAEMLEHQHDLEEAKKREMASRMQRSLDEFSNPHGQ